MAFDPYIGPERLTAIGVERAEVADAFWCYTGVVARPQVMVVASHTVASFAALGNSLQA